MKTNSMKMINKFIRRGGGANLNLFRYAAILLCVLLLGIGNAWAGGSSYYTGFKATGGATGKGYVYASTSDTATPAYETEVTAESQSDDLGENGTKKYYAWAKAVRGSEFNGWSISGDKGNVSPTSGTNSPITVTVTSAKDATNTGTATANWTSYTKVNVTYNPSGDGVYSVTYQYDSYNATTKEITTGDAENLSRTISSENGAQTIGSYKNDVITLKSTSGTFQGWYSDAGFTSLLSTDNPYTYTAPTSGSAAVYPKYEHVDKYYGRLTASIAEVPYSMPGGGTIFVSKEEAGTGTYSDAAQTVDNTGMGTTSLKYYLHAKPTDKRYVFRGWYDNPECTGAALSTNADYAYIFTSSSTNSASPTTGNVYAAFDFNLYYMEVQAQPATPGLGMVLVSDTKLTSPEYTQYSSESSQFAYAYRLTHTTDVYVYAKPKYGYKLSGWYTDVACTIAATVASDGKYTASSTASTDPLNPDTITLYAKFVEESKVSITYNLPDKSKGEYVAFALDIEEIDDEFVWIRTELYNSNNYTANTTLSQYKTDVLILDAEPKSGYGVTAWSDNGTSKSSLSHIYQTDATSAKSFGVTFGEAKPFLVSRNSTYYSDLQEAITATNGSGRITVVQNAYVPAGTYTIPSGVTLVVPFDANGSNYTSLSSTYTVHASWSQPSCYSKLTLASGCTINVNNNAVINVAAKEFEPDGGNKGVGAVATAYGQIDMEAGSAINVHSGGKLYCWGYITGDGMVTIENGAAVTEMLQTVSRGGTAFSSFSEYNEGDHCFPLNQYYIQNIEAYLRVNYGATETVWTSLYIRGDKITSGTFIGSNGSGFFELSSGSYLIRKYDPTTDRINYDIYGSAKLSHLSITIYISIDTKNYTMPITNNMTINCHAIGDTPATITVSYRMALLPSAVLSIDKNVTVDVSKKLYVYDRDEWVGKSFSYLGTDVTPICYSPTKTKTRASADLVDAKVIVNGTLKCSGEVYTTSSGAQICSSSNDGTGIVHFAAVAGTDANTYQAVQNQSSISTPAIPMTSAKLQNGDGSYVTTVGSAAGSKFYYSKSNEKWMKDPKTITWNANGGKTADATTVYSDGSFLGELPAAYKEGHTFAGWWTAASGGTQITQTTKVTANETYYAHWTPIQYNITYMDQGKAAFSGTHIDSPNAHPTKHTYGTTTTLNGANNKTGYDFGGWHTISNCKESSKVTSLSGDAFAKDITLYAKWTPQEYSITYKDKGGADFSGTSWASTQPTTHTYGTATTLVNPSKENYVFDGWFTSADCSGSAVTTIGATDFSGDFTLYAKWTPQEYSITYKDKGGADFSGTSWASTQPTTHTYGTATTLVNPSKENYVFDGWFTSADCSGSAVTTIGTTDFSGDFTLYAKWTPIEYTITWKVEGKADETTQVEYDAIPVYPHEAPYKAPGDEFIYTFDGWLDGSTTYAKDATLPAVTGETTYTAQFEEEARPYTITWLNYDGTELTTSSSYWGESPAYPAHLDKPTRTDEEHHMYRFNGWSPAIHEVSSEENVYTAQYELVEHIEVSSGEPEPITVDVTVTTTTVYVEGNLEIAEDVTLTTDDLILEGTPTTSGEITGRGRMSASNAYFHFKQDGGFKAKTWYAVAVPWEVDAETGVSVNGNTMTLGRDFDLIYYDGDRRAQGATKAWNYVEDDNDKIMYPGRAYMIYLAANAPAIRFKRAGNAELHNTSVTVNTYTGNDAQLNNWNGIANPALYHAYVNAGADDAQHGLNYGQVYDAETKSYKPLDMAANKLVVGQPIFVQAAEAKTFDVSRTEYASSLAPRRVQAAKPVHHEVSLISATTGKSDMIVVRMNEDKEENAYTVGQDLAKMGVSSVVPQLWIDRYDSRLCIHTAIPSGNEAEYPLSLYAPQAGEYQIAIHNSAMSNQQSDMLYLTYDGRAIWNLTYAPYTLSLDKETNTHYGLRVVASPAVATGMDEATIRNGNAVRKVLIDDHVFIIRNGEIYSTDGRLIK